MNRWKQPVFPNLTYQQIVDLLRTPVAEHRPVKLKDTETVAAVERYLKGER